MRCSNSWVCFALASPAAAELWPAVESTVPSAPTTVTWSGSSPSTLAATRFTIAWTCSAVSFLPSVVATRTEAVVFCCSSAKTSFFGIARCTVVPVTPSIDLIVLASSPSRARLYATCCMNSDVSVPCLSSSAYPASLCAGRPAPLILRRSA